MDENRAFIVWMKIDKESNTRALERIYRTSKSIDEFKQEYLKLQEKHNAYTKESTEKNRKIVKKEIQEAKEQYEKKRFKAIQSKSENTKFYQSEDTNKFLKNF